MANDDGRCTTRSGNRAVASSLNGNPDQNIAAISFLARSAYTVTKLDSLGCKPGTVVPSLVSTGPTHKH